MKEYDLRRLISTIEWDLPNIRNDELKELKAAELNNYKSELQELLLQSKHEEELIQ